MRSVCLRAFHNVQAAQGDKQNLVLRLTHDTSIRCKGVSRKEQFDTAFNTMSKSPLNERESGWEPVIMTKTQDTLPVIGWMWDVRYWQPRKLDTEMLKEFRERLAFEARKFKKDEPLKEEELGMINSVETETDVQKCVEMFAS